MTRTTTVPLYVDLDGTLTPNDTFLVSVSGLIRSGPWRMLYFPLWLLHGKAYFKRKVANRIELDASILPYAEDLVAFLHQQRNAGRRLVLITASDQQHADAVAQYLGFFDQAIGSDGVTNFSAHRKLDRIRLDCDGGEFDYAGNSNDDLEVWPHAREAIVVAPSPGIVDKARRCANVTRVFNTAPISIWSQLTGPSH